MNDNSLNRREFLKLLPLFMAQYPGLRTSQSLSPANQKNDPEKSLPNILILVFDTFSARHASFSGYQRNTTPHLTSFAKRATVYHRHYSAGNFTVPGTSSLLTGVYPWTHRGMHIFGTVKDAFADRNLFAALDRDYFRSSYTHNALVMNLLEQFHNHIDDLTPVRELALSAEPLSDRLFPNDNATAFWGERIIRGAGFDLSSSLFLSLAKIVRDFHFSAPEELASVYARLYPLGLPTHTIGVFFLLEDAMDWIMKQVTRLPQPFLGYYHLLPPHEPYRPRKEFLGVFEDGWQPIKKPRLRYSQNYPEETLNKRRIQYDEYLAYVDAEFGRLYEFLERSGVLENTYLIVTSDHGQLFERGIHGHLTPTLYEPIVQVPLLIAKPGQAEMENIYTPTSSIDVLPTILNLSGRAAPDWCEGQPLPGFGETSANPERRIFMVEAKSSPKAGPLIKGTVAMIRDPYKLISYFDRKRHLESYELYDLKNDPDEMEDLANKRNNITAELIAELAATLEEKDKAIQD